MANFSGALTLLIWQIVVLQVLASRKHPSFHQHFKRVHAFACKEPQMRALRVSDVINTGLEGKVFFPGMTVLHRCDSAAGCCLGGDKFTCGPVETEDVQLTFHVTHVLDTAEFKKGSISFDTVIVKNHTRCACVDESNLPR